MKDQQNLKQTQVKVQKEFDEERLTKKLRKYEEDIDQKIGIIRKH